MTGQIDTPSERTRQQRADLRAITDADVDAARLAELEYREGNLVRRLVVLGERHALTPQEVTGKQVSELAQKLADLRSQTDRLRQRLAADFDA